MDDNVLDSSWKAAYEDTIVAADARNPDGCRIPITWWVSLNESFHPPHLQHSLPRLPSPATWADLRSDPHHTAECRFSTCCAHGSVSSDCESVLRARAAGHELSTHTRTHSKE